MYQGKDRVFYKTLEERAAADARYEQNRLLKEQNHLIKKQQQDAERMQRQAEQKALREAQIERARVASENYERKLSAVRECINEQFDIIIKDHTPAMKAAGIGDPSEYIIKMIEVYKEDEEQNAPERYKITETISLKNIINKIDATNDIANQEGWGMEDEAQIRIGNLREEIQKIKKKFQIPLFGVLSLALPFLIWGMIEGFNYGFDDLFESAGGFIIPGIIFLLLSTVFINGIRSIKVEPLVKEYNEIILGEYEIRESRKLVKLERRRQENFNFNLEYELVRITSEFIGCNKFLEEQGFGELSFPDFRWRFFDYPQEFVEYCNKIDEDTEKKKDNKQKKAGLDIFDDL